MKANLITLERLKQRLTYDPVSGILTWNYCEGIHRDFNDSHAGKPAGSLSKDGYVALTVDRRYYFAHRLGWYCVTGQYPDRHVDHIDGDRANNAMRNLRLATPLQNTQNKTFDGLGGASKKRGAAFQKREGRWSSKIRYDGVYKWLGYFDDEDSAAAAYEAAAKELRGEFYRPQWN